MTSTPTSERIVLSQNDYSDFHMQRDRTHVAQTKTTMFNHEHGVTVVDSVLRKGVNRYSGKSYARWADESVVFYSFKSGRLRVYRKSMIRRPDRTMSWGMRDETAQLTNYTRSDLRVISALWDHLEARNPGIRKRTMDFFTAELDDYALYGPFFAVYPAIKTWFNADPATRRMNSVNAPAPWMRHENLRDMVTALYGKTSYRKDLIKAMVASEPYKITISGVVKPLVGIDTVIEFLRGDGNIRFSRIDAKFEKDVKYILSLTPPQRRRRLLLSIQDVNHPVQVADIRRMIEAQTINNEDFREVRSFAGLHETGAQRGYHAYRYTQEVPENVEFDLENHASATYHEVQTNVGRKIIAPSTSTQIREWGMLMHNCIAGYVRMHQSEQTLLGAVQDVDNRIIANFEVKPNGSLRQLLGKSNSTLPNDVQYDIIEALVSAGAVDISQSRGGWGITAPQLQELERKVA